MQSADLEVLRAALGWLEQGAGVRLVTVARTWGSSPRPPGSLLVMHADGRLVGSVSGGCVEDDLLRRMREQATPAASPEVLSYGVTAEQTSRFGLPCGGSLELVIETLAQAEPLKKIVSAVHARGLIARRVCLQTGEVSLHKVQRDQAFAYDGRTLVKVFGPVWRLLIIGAGQLSRSLAEMALALDYDVTVCDPREEYARAWQVEGVPLDARMPDDAVRALAADSRSVVVALTHDPKLDDMALMEALGSQAFYVGALGSRANSARRKARLASLGIEEQALSRLHGPVGLPIGSRTPAEIAVAILAELTAVRCGVRLQAMNADTNATAAPQDIAGAAGSS